MTFVDKRSYPVLFIILNVLFRNNFNDESTSCNAADNLFGQFFCKKCNFPPCIFKLLGTIPGICALSALQLVKITKRKKPSAKFRGDCLLLGITLLDKARRSNLNRKRLT